MGKSGEGLSRNAYKGPLDKDNGDRGRIECGRWEWVGQGRVVWVKWRQLYLNNKRKKKIFSTYLFLISTCTSTLSP